MSWFGRKDGASSRVTQVSKLNKTQKERVQQFISKTGASERSALASLKASDWNLKLAFEVFYSSSSPLSYARTDTVLQEQLYQRYKDPDADIVLVDGISRLCEDLEVEPSDVAMLVLSWHMGAATMCEFTREEFLSGLQSLGVDSVQKLKAAVPALRAELKDEKKFREIYDFTFGWAREKGQKSLALDTAIGMWGLLFEHQKWPYLEQWCEFLQVKHNKVIPKDTWAQLLEFTKMPEAALFKYDDEGAWPYLIDEFVVHLRELGLIPALESS